MSAVVEQQVDATLVLSTHRLAALRVTLRYRPEDPLAVRMAFPAAYSLDSLDKPLTPDGPDVEWVFARQLLAAGLDVPSGLGDVHIRPAAGHLVLVELRAPGGVALVRFDALELRRFLWRSHLAVPEGEERVDADAALAELLGHC